MLEWAGVVLSAFLLSVFWCAGPASRPPIAHLEGEPVEWEVRVINW